MADFLPSSRIAFTLSPRRPSKEISATSFSCARDSTANDLESWGVRRERPDTSADMLRRIDCVLWLVLPSDADGGRFSRNDLMRRIRDSSVLTALRRVERLAMTDKQVTLDRFSFVSYLVHGTYILHSLVTKVQTHLPSVILQPHLP